MQQKRISDILRELADAIEIDSMNTETKLDMLETENNTLKKKLRESAAILASVASTLGRED